MLTFESFETLLFVYPTRYKTLGVDTAEVPHIY